jgi:cytochrome c556
MAALNTAKLPERLKQREPEFQAARTKLSASVDALEAAVQANGEAKIKEAV